MLISGEGAACLPANRMLREFSEYYEQSKK